MFGFFYWLWVGVGGERGSIFSRALRAGRADFFICFFRCGVGDLKDVNV